MAYCEVGHINHILSEQGVDLSVDDNRSGLADIGEQEYVANAIQRAEAHINQFLARFYNLTSLSGNIWIRWACATVAAVYLMRRRGASEPSGLTALYEEVDSFLALVAQNLAIIPVTDADAGTATLLTQNAGITMSNLTVDQRYRYNKMRVTPANSTGPQASKLPRMFDDWARTYRQ